MMRKSVTLVEILVGVAIVALFLAIIIPGISGARKTASVEQQAVPEKKKRTIVIDGETYIHIEDTK